LYINSGLSVTGNVSSYPVLHSVVGRTALYNFSGIMKHR